MQITESNVTGDTAREVRKKLGMKQGEFWKPLGIAQSVGCRYEAGLNGVTIPASVKKLLIAIHVAGLSLDTSSEAGVSELKRVGAMQAKFKEATTLAKRVIKDMDAARAALDKTINSIEG